jgi:hypothetical protein
VLSDLALGFYTLLAAPLMVSLLFHATRLRTRLIGNILVLTAIGTAFLTVTRSAIFAMLPAFAMMAARARAAAYVALFIVDLVLVVAPVAYFFRITPDALAAVFSTQGGSVQGHLAAIQDSLAIIQMEPLGRGLGTAGQVAQVANVQGGITNEDWYLQIATEIGVVPAVIFALIIVGFAGVSIRRYRRGGDRWVNTLCLGMFGATVGYGLVGITLHVWEAEAISIDFWLLAGMVVRAQTIRSDAARDEDADRRLA